MTTRPIDEDDREFIAEHVRSGLDLLARYNVAEPTMLSPAKIGSALDAWKADRDANRPEHTEVIRCLGCLLGFYIVKSALGSWVVVSDTFGTTLGIRHSLTGWILYPLDVISKRTNDGTGAELVSIVDVFASDLAERLAKGK